MHLRIVIGVSQTKSLTTYAITVYSGNQFSQLEPVSYQNITKHRAILFGLYKTLEDLLKIGNFWEIDYYANDNFVSFEWETEYKCDHRFADSTKDQDIWAKIVKIVENNDIELNVHGEDNFIQKLNKNEQYRARRGNI